MEDGLQKTLSMVELDDMHCIRRKWMFKKGGQEA
jgi:hypothetical protein